MRSRSSSAASRPELGIRTRAEPLGEVGPELYVDRGGRFRQRLGVGVRADEVDPLDGVGDHVLDRVAAASARPPMTLMFALSV